MLLCGLALIGVAARAEAVSSANVDSEKVHAVFLFNLIRFTEWPAEALPEDSPFVIGVAGSRALEDELLDLADRQTVQERRIRVVRVKSVRELQACHVLYINARPTGAEDGAPSPEELLPRVSRRPVLTVGGSASFLDLGGIVRVTPGARGRLRFDIDAERARANGLVLSSQLLRLAGSVPFSAQG